MSEFVLIPGAGGAAWFWHRVEALLRAAGHEAIAVDLPSDDPSAGLDVYADRVVAAAGGRTDVVLVAQSLGGFVAPLVCARLRVRALVFVNAMIPEPGEKADDWGKNTGSERARREAAERGGYPIDFDDATYFYHDLPPDLVKEVERHDDRAQADRPMGEPCSFDRWPEIPIHVLVAEDDRLFPADFQERIARERLGVRVDRVPGGHLVALSNPRAVVDRLLTYAER